MTELSNVTVKGRLISKEDWEKYIKSLHVYESKLSKSKSSELIANSLVEAVKRRIPKKRFGICFSGGIDSTLIAFISKKLKADFVCYSVGVENSEDLFYADKIAKNLKFNHVSRTLSLNDLEITVKKVTNIVGEPDVVKVGVGSVFYSAAMLAKKDNISILFSGLGSEEIFAGYERHSLAKNVNDECWSGLKLMWERDLERDYKIANSLNLDVRTPFLDRDLIKTAMSVPGKYKISKDVKKLILREAAVKLGLEKEFAYRKKRAAQYGSRFNDALDKLARNNNFKLKKDYLASLNSSIPK